MPLTPCCGGAWTTNFYGHDGSGSVRLLTDSARNVTDTWDYDAFGNIIGRTGTTSNNYLYRGEQFDPDLGIYFQRARYYDQQRGRFFSMDDFDGFVDEPLSLHKYLYANADPANNNDPTGFISTAEYGVTSRQPPKSAPAIRELSKRIACVIIKTASVINPALTLPATLLEFAFCQCGANRSGGGGGGGRGGGGGGAGGPSGGNTTPDDLYAFGSKNKARGDC